MAETTRLMTIGEFSNLTRLSVRMLRHYDAHGVLIPADVDPWTGYRRYAPHQLQDAVDVRNLRDVGFGVSAISALLAARGTPAWSSALELQRETLLGETRAAQARLTLINRLIEGESTMSITIERRVIPAMTIVALRGIVPTYADEGLLWQRMMPEITRQGLQATGPCGVIEHHDEYIEHDVDEEIFLPIAPGTEVAPPLVVHDLPERDCLVARVVGPYDQITQAHDLIADRLANDGLVPLADGTLAARAFNLYLNMPDSVPAEELITEVYMPLHG
ncbi:MULTISPECIES: MerR family transcriptional regulator [unclassified Actinobaculum]|uniref:MerR family transcriptional regulator n=1 Tax=unclassified Actinobaculum TaxID=2609299 RepID=UPI000D52722A|nr:MULTISPECIES: MerR family transcriptional regulator [unclassified Actinobaculum]AWE42432.1 MerR family transcriptional regulator [Actinobaculum sp. 313]RTE48418.1 MerR family DNA-binding transcriptional regulator [Actinobaculum sp. 352]